MRTCPRALRPTHSRTSTLDMEVRPPISGECHCSCVPDDVPRDVTRTDVEITCQRHLPEACAPRDARHRRPIRRPLRRACLGAGRIGSGADPDSVPRSSAGAWPDLPVRVPRPERGFEHLGPRGGDACWPHHRRGRDQSVLSCAPASPFIGLAGCGVDTGVARARSITRGLAGTTAQSLGPPPWLYVFKPLHACDLQVPARDFVTPTRRGRSPHSMSSKRRSCLGTYFGAWLSCVSKSRPQDKVSAHAPGT